METLSIWETSFTQPSSCQWRKEQSKLWKTMPSGFTQQYLAWHFPYLVPHVAQSKLHRQPLSMC